MSTEREKLDKWQLICQNPPPGNSSVIGWHPAWNEAEQIMTPDNDDEEGTPYVWSGSIEPCDPQPMYWQDLPEPPNVRAETYYLTSLSAGSLESWSIGWRITKSSTAAHTHKIQAYTLQEAIEKSKAIIVDELAEIFK